MISLSKLDPDWKFADNHGKANKAGRAVPTTAGSTITLICRCCYEPIIKQPVPLHEHSKELQFMGFGYPLFYQFLKNCIFLLFITIASYNLMSFREAIANNYSFCHENNEKHTAHRLLAAETLRCQTVFVSWARIESSVSSQQEVARIMSFVIHLITLLYIRNRLIKLNKYYNERTPTFSGFCIIIKRLPKIDGIRGKIRQFFTKQFPQPHNIINTTLLAQYQQFKQLFKMKKKIINKLRPHYDKLDQNNNQFNQQGLILQKQLKLVQDKIVQVAQKYYKLYKQDQLKCQKIICILESNRQKQKVLKQFKQIPETKKIQYFGQKGKHITISQAPQPQQIIWQNVNCKKQQRILRTLLSYALSILTLAVIFVVIFFILSQKSKNLQHAYQMYQTTQNKQEFLDQYNGAVALVYCAQFVIIFFNKTIMVKAFHKFTQLQKQKTQSLFQFSFGLKLTFGFFFTTALMTLAVQAIRFKNYYTHPYGVIDQQSIMFFLNSFFIPLFWLVNPFRIAKMIKRKIYYGKRSLTQRQANKLMQDSPYQMGKRFAQVIQTMWFTFMYSTLLPVGALITIVGLIIYYWIDKYNLLRRSSISKKISGSLIQISLTLLDFTLILKPIGSAIFDKHLRDQLLTSNFILIGIGFIFILLPKNRLINFFNNQKFRHHQRKYSDLRHILKQSYNYYHPVVRIVGQQRLNQKVLKRGYKFYDTNKHKHKHSNTDYIENGPSTQKMMMVDIDVDGDMNINVIDIDGNQNGVIKAPIESIGGQYSNQGKNQIQYKTDMGIQYNDQQLIGGYPI